MSTLNADQATPAVETPTFSRPRCGAVIATPHSGNVTSDTDIAQEAWLSKRSLADHYDYSIRWVEDQMRRGMPSRRVGVQPRFRVSETDAWLDALAARRDVAPGAIASDASFEELAA